MFVNMTGKNNYKSFISCKVSDIAKRVSFYCIFNLLSMVIESVVISHWPLPFIFFSCTSNLSYSNNNRPYIAECGLIYLIWNFSGVTIICTQHFYNWVTNTTHSQCFPTKKPIQVMATFSLTLSSKQRVQTNLAAMCWLSPSSLCIMVTKLGNTPSSSN